MQILRQNVYKLANVQLGCSNGPKKNVVAIDFEKCPKLKQNDKKSVANKFGKVFKENLFDIAKAAVIIIFQPSCE